jgi:hypothetical protein
MLGAALDFVEVTGVADRLPLLHVGLLQIICPIAWWLDSMLALFGRPRNSQSGLHG